MRKTEREKGNYDEVRNRDFFVMPGGTFFFFWYVWKHRVFLFIKCWEARFFIFEFVCDLSVFYVRKRVFFGFVWKRSFLGDVHRYVFLLMFGSTFFFGWF